MPPEPHKQGLGSVYLGGTTGAVEGGAWEQLAGEGMACELVLADESQAPLPDHWRDKHKRKPEGQDDALNGSEVVPEGECPLGPIARHVAHFFENHVVWREPV